MGKYEPRLIAPSATDRNWMHTTSGGYNSCIHIKNGSVLPNCVGYAWGRWREILGSTPKLSRGNAENWWGYTTDGYERGQTPKVGAVICWRKGKAGVSSDGAGHVAIVEQVSADGTIVTSNSAYGSTRWYTKTIKPPYNSGKYVFQGFIYLPVTFDEPEYRPTVKEWQIAAIADGYEFPKYGADGKWGAECTSVAKKAIVKRRVVYTNKNLTKIVQRVVGTTADGKFGNNTKNAVIAWQKEHGLVGDGEVGPATWAVILDV